MELQLIRDNMETEQRLSAKPVQITVEAEAALPGGLREEARVYYADAAAQVNGGEAAGNRVMTDGRVTFHVLYAQGDLSHVSALETSADFSQTLPLREENPPSAALRMAPRAEVQHVSAKAFNGRLILRAIVQLSAEGLAPAAVSFVRDAGEGDGVERATQTLTIQRAVGEGEGQTLLREELELAEVLQIQDTLYATAQAQVEDILGGADGRAIVTGTITLEAYHTSAMPGRPLVYTRHAMPFEQAVGLSGALGDAMAARSEVRDVAVLAQDGPDGGKVMRAEVQLYTAVTAVENQEITALRDVFTTQGEAVETTARHVTLRTGMISEQTAESGKAALTLPDGSPRIKTPLLAFARPLLVKAERQKEKLAVDGILETTLLYLTEDSPIPVAIEQEEPFHALFATQAEPADELRLAASQVEASAITGDRVELKYILHLLAQGVRTAEAEVVSEAVPVDAASVEPGIALYFIQPGESAWDVAKRYRVPLSELQQLNPELPDQPRPGTPVIAYRR